MVARVLVGLASLLLVDSSTAQTSASVRRIQGSPKNGGTYHFVNRAWERHGGDSTQAGLTKILYNNTAPTGLYGLHTSALDLHWTDEGRLPSTSGHPNSTADSYVVNGFQIAYCAGGAPGPVSLGISFYDCYTACSDPRTITPVFASGTLSAPGFIPTGSNTNTCWLLTFNLLGTSLEFKLEGDCDGIFDDSSSIDNFGWQLDLSNGQSSNLLGPILAGDPLGQFGCAALPGDGTYYQAGACTSPYGFNFGTGLGYNDRHYSWTTGSGAPNGCYWFGGYVNGNPLSQFWLLVYGKDQDVQDPPKQVVYLNFGTVGQAVTKDDDKMYKEDGGELAELKKGARTGFAPTDIGFPNNSTRNAIIQKILGEVQEDYAGFNVEITKNVPAEEPYTSIYILSGSFPNTNYSLGKGVTSTKDNATNRTTLMGGGLDGYYIDHNTGQWHEPDGTPFGDPDEGLKQSPNKATNTLGIAQEIDAGNDDLNKHAWVWSGNFNVLEDENKNQQELANTISHELGHLLGLRHEHGEAGSIMGDSPFDGTDRKFSAKAKKYLKEQLPAKPDGEEPQKRSDKKGDTDQHGTSDTDPFNGVPSEDAVRAAKRQRLKLEGNLVDPPFLFELADVHAAEASVDGSFTDTLLTNGTLASYTLVLGGAGIVPDFIGAHLELGLLNVADVVGGAGDMKVFVDGMELIGALDDVDQRTDAFPGLEDYGFAWTETLFLDEFLSIGQLSAALADGTLVVELLVGGASDAISVDSVAAFVTDDGDIPEVGTKYCTANPNSTGSPADIAGFGSASSAAGDLTLEAGPVPNQPGIFYHGANQIQVSFGNGFNCVGGNIRRGAVVFASGNLASYTYDNSDAKHDLSAHVGANRKFQYWYRDPMGGGAQFNTSNAIAIDILP